MHKRSQRRQVLRTVVSATLTWLVISHGALAEEQVLASDGIWELTRLKANPFEKDPIRCEARTTLPGGNSGRREQGRLRLSVSGDSRIGEVFIDPPVMMTQAIRLRRKVVDRRDAASVERRTDLGEALLQRLRVDDGRIFEYRDSTIEFGSWAVHGTVDDFEELSSDLTTGDQLHFQWSLGPASDTTSYDLTGLRRILKLINGRC